MAEMISSPEQIETPQEEKDRLNERRIIDDNWNRFEYCRDRGHIDYCAQARRNERFYLGGGEQWDAEDRKALEAAKRPVTEINEIMPAVNSAVGYQINNRAEFTYLPRSGDADAESAKVMSKVAKHILDNLRYRWLETDIFEDGMIQQRGYLDLRLKFDDSLLAEADLRVLDPLDVMPDPDAKSYDPDGWADVTITYWRTLDEIEQLYGAEKRLEVENYKPADSDHGDDSEDEGRNKFGDKNTGAASYDAWLAAGTSAVPRVRIVDRQFWKYVETKVGISPMGDVRIVEELPPQKLAEMEKRGYSFVTRKMRRVWWTVTTKDVLLFNEWSPFDHFTVIPYFPYFRRGKTRGMVDNAISPQETLNKAMSSLLHTTNTVANSGWITEENTLVGMSSAELRQQGAQTGLHIEVRAGTPKDRWPTKITPNPVPAGFDRIIEHSHKNLQDVTVNEELRGKGAEDASGIAIQSRQFAAQQGLARPLDNLARTRHMLGERLLKLIQRFYDDPRVLRIRGTDPMTGRDTEEALAINQQGPDGILNDLTLGEYGLVVAEVPLSVTFDNSQFQQALDMKKVGVAIPDAFLVKNSTLADKAEIIDAMQGSQQPDPLTEAQVDTEKAKAAKLRAETVVKNVEGIFSATEAAQNIAALPQVAPLADDILGSAGYEDKDGPPLVPPIAGLAEGMVPAVPPPPENTDPRFPRNPPSPMTGINEGIEGGGP